MTSGRGIPGGRWCAVAAMAIAALTTVSACGDSLADAGGPMLRAGGTDASPAPSPGAAAAASLSFRFQLHSPQGYIDQILEITNANAMSVVPTLRITPLDKAGHMLTDVAVSTAYGSDHGRLVVGPGQDRGLDILTFTGAGRAEVAGVSVTVTSLASAVRPAGALPVTLQTADQDGDPVSKFAAFQKVLVTNPNAGEVAVRMVYIVYDQPTTPDEPQQSIAVVPIGGLTFVPANGTVTVPVDADAAAVIATYSAEGAGVSVKAYFSQ